MLEPLWLRQDHFPEEVHVQWEDDLRAHVVLKVEIVCLTLLQAFAYASRRRHRVGLEKG